MKYVISGNRAYVSINDEITVIQKDSDPRFHEILALIRNGDEGEVRRLILEGEVKLGKLKVSRKGVKFDTKTLHPAFAKAYLYAAEADKSAIELFFKNVAENPNKDSQADLANFLLRNALPITDRGTFLAYRYVNDKFYDCHTGTMDNMIGNTVEMARENCDSDREVTCSRGLHVCHYSYLANGGDVHLVVEINPRRHLVCRTLPSEHTALSAVGLQTLQALLQNDLRWTRLGIGRPASWPRCSRSALPQHHED
jgi:hypothetical protein